MASRAAWEALVFVVNREKTERIRKFADNAQWFENNMPFDAKYRKANVKGIVANAIDVVVETGDSGPVTPVGINLPNDQRIREEFGSKSVSLSNVNEAYDKSSSGGMRTEFSWTPEEAERSARFGTLSGELHTDMHEVIGHASGQQAPGFRGTPQAAIKEHFSALEEGRADLIALYFIADPKLAELGIVPAADQEAIARTEYEAYTRNAIVQLRRVREGTQIEEDHMRNRQMVVRWLLANTKAIDGATARREDVLRDGGCQGVPGGRGPAARRGAAHQVRGRLRRGGEAFRRSRHPLRPQAEGRGGGARGRAEAAVLHRVRDAEADGGPRCDGAITDVTISYPQDLTAQMLEYSGARR